MTDLQYLVYNSETDELVARFREREDAEKYADSKYYQYYCDVRQEN